MSGMKPSEILTAARDYIGEHGWVQGQFAADDGRVCALMGVRMVAILSGATAMMTAEAFDALGAVALELTGCDVVPIYNDLHCRDVQDVYDWFGKALCQLEERGL